MKQKSESTFILVILASFPMTAAALPPLGQVVDAAEEHAFDARVAETTVRRADADRAEATSRLLPSFTATGTYAHNQYDGVARIPDGTGGYVQATFVAHDQLDGTLSLELPLLDVAAIARLRGRRASLDAARLGEESTRLLVATQAVRAYYDLAAGIALVESAERSEAVARESARVLRVRLGAGLVSELEVARADAEAERRLQIVAEARLRRANAKRTLELLVGAEVDASPLAIDATTDAEAALDVWLARAGALPSVRAADARAAASMAERSAARAAYLPTLTAVAAERFTSAPGFGQYPSYQIALRAQLRLDFGIPARVRAASAAADAQTIEAERVLAEATNTIATAWDTVESARQRVVAARAARVAADRAVAVARSGREAGSITALELLEAERDQFASEVAAIEAEAALEAARGQLRLVVGERIR